MRHLNERSFDSYNSRWPILSVQSWMEPQVPLPGRLTGSLDFAIEKKQLDIIQRGFIVFLEC
jgi:hypothetical protein